MRDLWAEISADKLSGDDIGRLPIPKSYEAVTVHRDEVEMFDGWDSRDKDPRKSLHLEEVPTPELGPGEARVAVAASAINYNTVWSSIFEPVPTFPFLDRYAKQAQLGQRHSLPYHVLGSDLSGVVLRTGPGVRDRERRARLIGEITRFREPRLSPDRAQGALVGTRP